METLTFGIQAQCRPVFVFPLISQRQYAETMQTSEEKTFPCCRIRM